MEGGDFKHEGVSCIAGSDLAYLCIPMRSVHFPHQLAHALMLCCHACKGWGWKELCSQFQLVKWKIEKGSLSLIACLFHTTEQTDYCQCLPRHLSPFSDSGWVAALESAHKVCLLLNASYQSSIPGIYVDQEYCLFFFVKSMAPELSIALWYLYKDVIFI